MDKIIAVISALLVSFSLTAQMTTSSISGKITDAAGEPLEGATVVAVHNPSGTQYYAIVNESGRYVMSGLRPGGPYDVTISFIGFETVSVSDVSLSLGETLPLSISLNEDAVSLSESIVVSYGSIDAFKTGASQSIGGRRIQEVPSISRGIADVVRYNPLVRTDGVSGAMSFAGVNNRYNSFQIDGVMNNDVFGLSDSGLNGGQAGTQPVSMETVDQIQINIAPFDVRQSGFTGATINAVTKSGTNQFHASAYGFGNNQSLYGRYSLADGNLSSRYSRQMQYQAGVTVSGPIVKDKLFFFASFEAADNQYPNNYGLGSASSNVDPLVAQEVYEYFVKESKRQGNEYKGYLPTDLQVYTKSDKATAKLDWNINDNNHFNIRWSLVAAKRLNAVSEANFIAASDYSYDFVSNTNSIVAELQSKFSQNLENDLRVSFVGVSDARSPRGDRYPMVVVSGVGNGSVCFGNERSSVANTVGQNIFTLADDLNWLLGSHTVTFGTHNEYYSFSNAFVQDKFGTYYYATPDDFYSGVIKQYRYQHVNQDVAGSDNWVPSFHSGQLGFYAQDKWAINDNFSLTYGLRMDIPLFFDLPVENKEFTQYASSRGWNVKTNQMPKSSPLLSPRLGFRWDVAGDGRYILRGGAGIFTGRIPFVWISNNFANTGVQYSTYNANGAQKTGGLSLILDPDGQAPNESKLKASGSQTVNVVDPDLKMNQSAKFDLGFDFNVLGIDWTVEGLFSKTINDMMYKQLAYSTNGATLGSTYPSLSFDDRPMFSQTTTGTPFTGIYELTNTNKGYSYNLTAQARKSFNFGLDVNASYTYSKSMSVFNGNSSVAQSNFAKNPTHGDANDPELSNSAFNIPHQIKVAVSYHKSYGASDRWTSTASAIYIGSSGATYSLVYYGDLNGDSSNSNDLLFIPTDEQIDKMQFKATTQYSAEQQAANYKHWLSHTSYLKDHRGEYFDRFADNLPFESHLDLHLAQKFSFMVGSQMHSLELSFDIINFTNMLNPSWGRSYGMGLTNTFTPVTYSGNGQFQFLHDGDYNMFSYNDNLSRWRGQIGLRYSF